MPFSTNTTNVSPIILVYSGCNLRQTWLLISSSWKAEKKLHWHYSLWSIFYNFGCTGRFTRRTTQINVTCLASKNSTQKDLNSLKTTENAALYCLKHVLCEHGLNLTPSTGAVVMKGHTVVLIKCHNLLNTIMSALFPNWHFKKKKKTQVISVANELPLIT